MFPNNSLIQHVFDDDVSGLEQDPFEPFVILEDDVNLTDFGDCLLKSPGKESTIVIPETTDALFFGLWVDGTFWMCLLSPFCPNDSLLLCLILYFNHAMFCCQAWEKRQMIPVQFFGIVVLAFLIYIIFGICLEHMPFTMLHEPSPQVACWLLKKVRSRTSTTMDWRLERSRGKVLSNR